MEVDFAIAQDVGQRRDQQDSGAACPLMGTRGYLLTVADGLGGHVAGGEASHIATEVATEAAKSGAFAVADERGGGLLNTVETANQRIRAASRAHGPKATMGTTFVAALLAGDGLSWVSVGDSHLYLLRNGQMAKLNADHSQAGLMLQSGRYREGDPEVEQYRSLLRSALTGSTIDHTDLVEAAVPLQGGDLVILASDGLNTIERRTIETLVAKANGASAQAIADDLIDAVRRAAKSGQDNTTVVVGRVTKVDGKPPRMEAATEIATAIASRRPARFDFDTVPATLPARNELLRDDAVNPAPRPGSGRSGAAQGAGVIAGPGHATPVAPAILPPASPVPIIEHRTNWQLWALLGAAAVVGIIGGLLAAGRSSPPPLVNQGLPAPGTKAPIQPATVPPPAVSRPQPPAPVLLPKGPDTRPNLPTGPQQPLPQQQDGSLPRPVTANPPPAQVGQQPGLVQDPAAGQVPPTVVDEPQPARPVPAVPKFNPPAQVQPDGGNTRGRTFSPVPTDRRTAPQQ
jgi:serine/threonine protein phosphatase PrpC